MGKIRRHSIPRCLVGFWTRTASDRNPKPRRRAKIFGCHSRSKWKKATVNQHLSRRQGMSCKGKLPPTSQLANPLPPGGGDGRGPALQCLNGAGGAAGVQLSSWQAENEGL